MTQPGQQDIDAAIDRYAACRGPVGHHWSVQRPHPADAGVEAAIARFVCAVCGGKRRDVFDRTTGELFTQHYDYPPDYDTVGKHNAAWWRARWAMLVYGPEPPIGHNVVGITRQKK